MRHFLFEDKEYRYRPRFKRGRQNRDSAVELARLFKMAGKGFRRMPAARRTKDLRQKCIAKMQYSSSIEAHKVQLEKYLVREGAGLDGKPELFGTEITEYQKNMVGKNFRIFLSPESSKVDVKVLAEQFIDKLQKQTGYQLYWQGACHYNTAHPHAHLLINGVDKNDREVTIPKDIVKTYMREAARNLCTAQIGKRTQQDLDREKEQELTAGRHTKLDDRIQSLCVDSRVSLRGAIHDKERIQARLETLRKLKLCTYQNGGYTLKKDWEEDLRTNGRYNTFLKARDDLRYSAPSLLQIYSGKDGIVSGKVTKIYRIDEDASDNHAVVIESLDGKAYFVPLFKKPELHDGKGKPMLKEGELISVKTYESQKGRLTPVFFKRDTRSAQKEIRQNHYSGTLASEINKVKPFNISDQKL